MRCEVEAIPEGITNGAELMLYTRATRGRLAALKYPPRQRPVAPPPAPPAPIAVEPNIVPRKGITPQEIDHLMRALAEGAPPPKIEDVILAVCDFYSISIMDIKSSRRDAASVKPRHVAMYLARDLTGKSLPMIGRSLGGRDHTTALHGARKVGRAIGKPIAGDPEPPPATIDVVLAEQVEAIKRKLETRFNIEAI